MKINFRSLRKIKNIVIVCLLFCLMFPYSLFATEAKYKVPKSSISYFVENPTQEVNIVAPPEPSTTTPPTTEVRSVKPKSIAMAKAPNADTAIKSNADEHFELSWNDETKKKVAVSEKKIEKPAIPEPAKKSRPAPIVTQKNVKKTTTVKVTQAKTMEPEVFVASRSESPRPAFSAVLARMQKRSAQRKAEAEKLGIVLPSQGGDMSAASPALSKINSAVKNILDRHNCPATGSCNFCQ